MSEVIIKTNSKEEDIKYAYAFMLSECLRIKECGFLNPEPKEFDERYLIPQDSHIAVYEDAVPSWEEFKANQVHLTSAGFACVAALDDDDIKRVVLSSKFNGVINFNYNYAHNDVGDYEKEAKEALKNIKSIFSSLK
ncbi:hypothetical protein QTG56_25390 (plasmid) [Rossellomorea sp. AcN35-11]|nr:hypothetical protein [Rossellomorea aquimaris]WJV31951.1 hypothetical protein QTG56_25390 [Rossellomorea sp. AcN35-11]